MTPYFADTFYFLSLLNPADAKHGESLAIANRESRHPMITTKWVLAEVGDGLSSSSLRHLFVKLIEILRSAHDIEIVADSDVLFDAGLSLYSRRPDKDWSLTDCISFEVMREQGLTEALTGDHHFEQAGFTALLK